MPQLPTFTANVAGNPVNSGRAAGAEDFGVSIGNTGKGLAEFANDFVQEQENDQSRKALIGSTQIRAQIAKEMDDAALTGAPLEPIRQKMHDQLAALGQDFTTKKGVESLDFYTANSDISFQQKANEIQVTRATVAARMDASKFLNSAGAIIQSNPAYLAVAEKDAENLAATWTGATQEKRAEIADGLKKDLNMAAAIASARSDPKGTKEALEAGKWDLTPEQRNIGINRADTELRAARADQVFQREQAEHAQRLAVESSRDEHFKAIMAGGKGVKQAIMDDPTLSTGSGPAIREHLIEFMETRARSLQAGDKKSDPVAVRNAFLAITAPEGTPGKQYNGDFIFNLVRSGSVNVADGNFLNNLVAGQKDENGRTLGTKLNQATTTVGRALAGDPQFTMQPGLVASAQLDYQARVMERVDALRKANQDPSQVFNPDSKDFVGTKEFIQPSITKARQERAAQAGDALPVVSTKAERDALPDGATYRDPQGNVSTKKGGAAPAKLTGDQRWMQATGGVVPPGKTRTQTVEDWLKANP